MSNESFLDGRVLVLVGDSIHTNIEAAKVASTAIRDFLAADDQIRQVRLVFFEQRDARVFLQHQEF